MKRLSINYSFVLFSCLLACNVYGAKISKDYTAVVSRIIDGDGFIAQRMGRQIPVRLYGIDAPEYGDYYANEAKKYLTRQVLGKTVIIREYYTDTYGRKIADVFLGKRCINQLLVERGFAWVHIYYCHRDVCVRWKKKQALARKEKRGVWRQKKPVPPWVRKHSRK